jgi:hypothetical protein
MSMEEDARVRGGQALQAYIWTGVSEYESNDLRYMLDNDDGEYEKVEIKSSRGLRVHPSWHVAGVKPRSHWTMRKAGW